MLVERTVGYTTTYNTEKHRGLVTFFYFKLYPVVSSVVQTTEVILKIFELHSRNLSSAFLILK